MCEAEHGRGVSISSTNAQEDSRRRGEWSYEGGHEPMKLFKANPAAQSEADRARDLRLTSIASRYRPRSDTAPEPQPSE